MTKFLAVFALFLCVLPAYSNPKTAYYPTVVVFDGNRNPRKSVVQFIPSKIQLERSDFFNKAVEIRGEWFFPRKKGWSPVIEVTGAQMRTLRTETVSLEIWNMGGILPPEPIQPFRLPAGKKFAVYYEIPPALLEIPAAAPSKPKLFIDLIVRVGSRMGKILLPAIKIPR